MATARSTPTQQSYAELQHAYDFFNQALYEDCLPGCLITLQREKATCGYFSQNRFANLDGQLVDEIALNPVYFAVVPLIETLQTLVHEMAHLWQHHFGKPGRGRYHNEEWGTKMEAIGLMPSHTGRPGGKRLGDHMADYAIEGGKFLAVCKELITQDYKISWYDRFPSAQQINIGQSSHSMQLSAAVGGGSTPSQMEVVKASLIVREISNDSVVEKKSNRTKYSCTCLSSIWGKPGLQVQCLVCNSRFEAQQS